MNAPISDSVVSSDPVEEGWSAQLRLDFEARPGKTVLARNEHSGPLRVQRAFYPEQSGQCHVYLLHPPGGIVAGDSLHIDVSCRAGSHGLLTTPSAGRVYRSNASRQRQSQHVSISVESGAVAEWLPQENILFNGAEAHNHTCVQLQPGAQFIGWEINCLGRPASQAWFENGTFQQSLSLYCEDRPLLLERNRFVGGADLLEAKWGLQGALAMATLVCTSDSPALKQEMNALCQAFTPASATTSASETGLILAATTQIPELLIVRAFAQQAEPLKKLLWSCWREYRLALLDEEPEAPRIWLT